MYHKTHRITSTAEKRRGDFGISCNRVPRNAPNISLEVASTSLHEISAKPPSILFLRKWWERNSGKTSTQCSV